jgi:hypothetical protein
VVVYVASVRASAKVVTVAAEDHRHSTARSGGVKDDDEDAAFGFGFDEDVNGFGGGAEGEADSTIVTLQFIASREFVELDAQVLVIPGGGPGLYGGTERGEKGIAGLEGFVGRVVEGSG